MNLVRIPDRDDLGEGNADTVDTDGILLETPD